MKKLDIFGKIKALFGKIKGNKPVEKAQPPSPPEPAKQAQPTGKLGGAFGGTGTGRKLARGLDPQAVARAMEKAGRG